MYIEDPRLHPPVDRNATIWRFLDFPKFVSVLVDRSLHFSRADYLDDPFEGTFGRSPEGTARVPWFGLSQAEVGTGDGRITRGPNEFEQEFIKRVNQLRARTFVNCWHLNEYEPASMWAQYVRQGVGVAIRSSVGRLIAALESCPHEIRVSEVLYVDHAEATWEKGYPLVRFIHKRRCFEHERELRVLIDGDPEVAWREVSGIPVSVDPSELVTELRISPGAPPWFGNLVVSLTNRFGLRLATRRSELDDRPLY